MSLNSPSLKNEDKEHLSIRETELIPPEELKDYEREINIPQKEDILSISTPVLWCTSSWIIILLNVAQCLIALRDMLYTQYDPLRHGISILIFVATIGSLVAIHQYIIKKD